MLNKYYLVFSGPEQNSDQNQYAIVYAHNSQQAYETFKSQYEGDIPLVHYYYEGNYWNEAEERRSKQKPTKVLYPQQQLIDLCGFNDLCVFVPEHNEMLRISEGTGDNLSQKDINNGLIDYIYYDQYDIETLMEVDGGQLMTKEFIRDKYACLADALLEVLDLAYGNPNTEVVVLKPNTQKSERKENTMSTNQNITEKKVNKLLKTLTEEEKDAIYRNIWFDHVVTDIKERLDDLGETLTEDEIHFAASEYVDGNYDCNLSYWTNIDNLITKAGNE